MILSLGAILAPYSSAALLQGGGIPWWVWVLIVIVLIVLGVWLTRRPSQEGTPPAAMSAPEQPAAISPPEQPAAMQAPEEPAPMRAAPAAEAPAPVEAPAAMAEAPPAAATAPDMPTAPAMPEAPAAHEMAETPAMTATLTPQPAVRDVPPRSDAPATTVTQPPRPAVRPTPDDLTRIEGIGPATAKALNAGGITTFQQLADADSAQVNDILRNAGVRVSDPGTWGQQAKLAAAGDWARLKKLQDKLVGGRKA